MLKFIGFISKEMFYTQNKSLIGVDLGRYTIPLTTIDNLDINRQLWYNEETGEIVIESLKDKGTRQAMLFEIEKQNPVPIIGIDREDMPFEEDEDELDEIENDSDSDEEDYETES